MIKANLADEVRVGTRFKRGWIDTCLFAGFNAFK